MRIYSNYNFNKKTSAGLRLNNKLKTARNHNAVTQVPGNSVYMRAFCGNAFITRNCKLKAKIIKDNFYNIDAFLPEYSQKEVNLQKILTKCVPSLKNNPYTIEKTKVLLDTLRSGEQRDFQLDTVFRLIKNPVFVDGDDITNIAKQVKNKERADFWVEKCKELSSKKYKLNGKELAIIVPRLREYCYPIQHQFISDIYLKSKSNSNPKNEEFLYKFGLLLSTAKEKNLASIQTDFFKNLVGKYKVEPSAAIDLVSNVSNVKNGETKPQTIYSLIEKGLQPEDLSILIPKIKSPEIANLELQMADYFMKEAKIQSAYASKIMTNIESPNVFKIQKDFIEKISKLRNFDDDDLLNTLGDMQNKDKSDLKYNVIKELAKIDKLGSNDIMRIIANVDTPYNAELKVQTAQNLLKIGKLSSKNIANIVDSTNSNDASAVKCEAVKRLSKIDGLNGDSISLITHDLLKKEVADLQIDTVKELMKYDKLTPDDVCLIAKGVRNIDLKNAKLSFAEKLVKMNSFKGSEIASIVDVISAASHDDYLFKSVEKLLKVGTLSTSDITKIVTTMKFHEKTYSELIDYFSTIPENSRAGIKDYSVVQDFYPFKDKAYLNKLEKKNLLSNLVKHNASIFRGNKNNALCQLFPFLPSSKNEYCQLLPLLVQNVLETDTSIPRTVLKNYFESLENLSKRDGAFVKFDLQNPKNNPKSIYTRENFIDDIKRATANMNDYDKRNLLDCFSFCLGSIDDKPTIKGYPTLPKVPSVIKNKDFKEIYDNVYDIVASFTADNSLVVENSPEIERELNKILKAVPELYTTVGKVQHNYQDYTLFTHMLRVLQEIYKNPAFEQLNDGDKKLLGTAALLHDISKSEYVVDPMHSKYSALDAFEIASRFDFSPAQRDKLTAIIRNHEWLKFYNKKNISELEKVERAKEIAFSTRSENTFDLVSILEEADLKGVKRNDEMYNLFKDKLIEGKAEVSRYVRDLQRTAIVLPQNKLPKASELVPDYKFIRKVNIGGIRNKVIYLNKDVNISQLNLCPNGDTGDFSVLVHALDSEKSSLILQCLDEVDSNKLVSSSYVNLDKGNWKVFRQQGFILDVDCDNIHAGYYRDFGSGLAKTLDNLQKNYLFEGSCKPKRDYISKLIKESLHINDEEYRALYKEIKDMSFAEIREKHSFVAASIKKIFMDMQGGEYTYGRNYNEILVSKPRIQGVFAYDKSITQVSKYLRQYAQDADIPIIIFED